ncbi:MAG: hypothetical protein LBF77_07645 [Spirochaetaceae bacterium]|jgi:hypothetical protein|nr:hypothetical protein [Spirochaetaceae bacterium]
MKFPVLIVFFVLTLTVFPVSAQDAGPAAQKYENESEFYPIGVPVEKIYNYPKGYIVQYRRGAFDMATAYLPLEWFAGTEGKGGKGGKGEIVNLRSKNTVPRLVAYYKGGEFSHVRLYVHPNRYHESWGLARVSAELDGKFENQDNFRLQF